ncbi:MAG: hypothetical protein BroJett015_09460 [Chloroflexota bacterium]|nr:hypothetical protein [Chloroflexota bacterium]GIK55283.1 MAG: hypothetical protein BroJett015_09460 [Chloroflexota bacterium]
MGMIGSVMRWFTERMGRNYTLVQLAEKLEKSGQTVHGRMESTSNSESHRKAARHIIGIERWSQSRLRVALGDPLTLDEYDGYCPDAQLDMAALARAFAETRQESIQLAQQLEAAGVSPIQTVRHNELGDLTIRGWLVYIGNHAWRESFVLR